jgi:hypothetical protein
MLLCQEMSQIPPTDAEVIATIHVQMYQGIDPAGAEAVCSAQVS